MHEFGKLFIIRNLRLITLLLFTMISLSFSRNAHANPVKSGNSELIIEVSFELINWNGKLIDTIPQNATGQKTVKNDEEKNTPDKDDVLTRVEQMPQFGSGEKELLDYLSKSIKYPRKARNDRVQGTVVVQFVINRKGKVTDVKVVRSVRKDLDKETIRVVKKMPDWKPGRQDGKPVKVRYTLPVRYRLE